MLTRLTCSIGHEWEPAAASASPLVCPKCGRAALPGAGGDEQTIDDDRTVDLPTPTPASRSEKEAPGKVAEMRKTAMSETDSRAAALPSRDEVTQTMHFTPPPSPAASSPSAAQTSMGGGGILGRSMGGGSPNMLGAGAGGMKGGMPFTIVRQHARGGLWVVSLARDEHIKREVALKQILPQHADNGVLNRRFLYEAQITGQLEHPSIVPVYTLGNDEAGRPYYVMRFVKGRTLDEIIKEYHGSPNPIVFRELLRRFIAVCQAVAYAHSRGVIHRDLKPANIMLGDYGETLVLDWGLAKDIKQGGTDPALWAESSAAAGNPTANGGAISTELTMQGQIIGTPAYMAPEQAEGRTELHGPVTDIYALGGILYKILAGKSPQAPTASTTGTQGGRRLTFVPSPPPSTINSEVNPVLEQICMHAMATEPGARYPRALEMAQDIQRWLDERPLVVRARTAQGRVVATMRNHMKWVLLAMAAMLVVIIGLSALLAAHSGR